jgi:DNA-binding transcriptional ArsR family regulator
MLDYRRRHAILKHVLNQEAALDRLFQALSDPTRRALVEQLTRGPASVSVLSEPHPMSLAAVVQHLQVLEESGLIHTEKRGRVRTCRLRPSGLELAERWLCDRRRLWEGHLDRLGELLDEIGSKDTKERKKP